MTDLSGLLLDTALPAVIAAVVVLLGRRSQTQFTIGCVIALVVAMLASLYSPHVVTVYHGPDVAAGYSTWATAIATLYAVAQVAIWRGFAKPGWLALLATVLPALAIGSMGAWQT
jgi:hypothetical protein